MTKNQLTRQLAKAVKIRDTAANQFDLATKARNEAIRLLYREHDLKLRELAALSGITIGRISQIVGAQNQPEEDHP